MDFLMIPTGVSANSSYNIVAAEGRCLPQDIDSSLWTDMRNIVDVVTANEIHVISDHIHAIFAYPLTQGLPLLGFFP
eukprot:SAG22_NODE_20165_length_268_cov_0.591716_1_plen_76_part_01